MICDSQALLCMMLFHPSFPAGHVPVNVLPLLHPMHPPLTSSHCLSSDCSRLLHSEGFVSHP